MRLRDIQQLNEASGYIPKNEKEAADPRWQMAITNDIKPGETQRQASKMGWSTDTEGKPPKLKTNGSINESLTDVAVQSRQPISAGARGLLHARSEFDKFISRSNETVNRSAADALAWAVKAPVAVNETVFDIAYKFKMAPEQLNHVFKQNYGMTVYEFAKKCHHNYKHASKKI